LKKREPIRGWRDRVGLPRDFKLYYATAVEQAMLDEIGDLRERLALKEAPAPPRDPRQLDLLEDAVHEAQVDPAE
jgi:hypothetical protein